MNLRRKLEEDPASPRFVVTVPGVGYRFAEEVPE
jgi:DNA-binding response OmpR family regulator